MSFLSAIVLIIAAFVIYAIFNYGYDALYSQEQDISYIPDDPRENDHRLNKFNVMGLKYYDVSKINIGRFSGYAIAEKDNEYDEFAVSFYKSDGKMVGHARRESDYLHESIIEQGGKVDLIGDIYMNKHTGNLQADVYIDYRKHIRS